MPGMNALHISSGFDAGAIEVVSLSNPRDIQLRIPSDNAADFAQWFYFCLHGASGLAVTLKFLNAGQCAYPGGWKDYAICASYDRQNWFRIETSFDGTVLTGGITPTAQRIYFAYFEPYSWEQHLDLLGVAGTSPHVTPEWLGSTVQGRDLSLLRITDTRAGLPIAEKKNVWIMARQHPGETMAAWFIDGLLERLLDGADAVSRALLQACVFYIVPTMNPDGGVLGNLRTNAAGANLNREWQSPSLERSPEVWHVRERMLQTGVDLCLDIHGDETLPYVFVAGSEGVPAYSPRVADLESLFKGQWMTACPDFQDTVNYGLAPAGSANLSLATNWVAQQFSCLAFTVEMPFKDNALQPDQVSGWSAARSRALGASVLTPILATL